MEHNGAIEMLLIHTSIIEILTESLPQIPLDRVMFPMFRNG